MELSTFENCPHCGAKIKSSTFGTSVVLYSERATNLINKYVDQPQLGYCSKCGEQLYQNARTEAKKEYRLLQEKVTEYISQIPVITLQQPYNWAYNVVTMITAQSTLGTGVFTDFVTSFTDMLGSESKRYNEKVKSAENNCLTQLRLQAVDAGANAVIGADIDYSEIGGAKSMVLVCMSGTAVKINNPEIISPAFGNAMEDLKECRAKMEELSILITEPSQN